MLVLTEGAYNAMCYPNFGAMCGQPPREDGVVEKLARQSRNIYMDGAISTCRLLLRIAHAAKNVEKMHKQILCWLAPYSSRSVVRFTTEKSETK